MEAKEKIDDLESLESILFNVLENSKPLAPTGFVIDSESKANWAAATILKHEAHIQRQQDLAQMYKQQIDAWLIRSTSSDEKSIDFLKSCLEPYITTMLGEQAKGNTIHLLSADICMRKLPDKVQVIDEESALKYCSKNLKKAVVVKKSLSKVELKSALSDGKTIPGVEIEKGIKRMYLTSSYAVSAMDDIGQKKTKPDSAIVAA